MRSPEAAAEFLQSRWPDAMAISDPERTLYRALDLGRATMGQVLGLRVWKQLARALRFGVGKPVGDTLALGGTFLMQGPRLLASESADHVGHVPDFEGMAELARARAEEYA